ncbi:LOW QUALITY PROTEIN: hypothetical protein Cgig2_001188 [Carnegiea gigantea]|uniref:Uncharacterized protein n=1 Tax=Carnegiea gigantea TaxID=171969 RepID=A0A9Q1K172_9CARY|nr:LOW QUALITY PROTEIN: hypothetical protein Cgig2_001188 [Carnegiea gigantea]
MARFHERASLSTSSDLAEELASRKFTTPIPPDELTFRTPFSVEIPQPLPHPAEIPYIAGEYAMPAARRDGTGPQPLCFRRGGIPTLIIGEHCMLVLHRGKQSQNKETSGYKKEVIFEFWEPVEGLPISRLNLPTLRLLPWVNYAERIRSVILSDIVLKVLSSSPVLCGWLPEGISDRPFIIPIHPVHEEEVILPILKLGLLLNGHYEPLSVVETIPPVSSTSLSTFCIVCTNPNAWLV